MNPFDYVKNLTHEKKYIMCSVEQEREYQKTSFIINKVFSFGKSTVLFSNEMNKAFFTLGDHSKLQYDFYFHLIPKGRMFNKWINVVDQDKIKILQEYYQINFKRAKEYLSILTKDQFDVIKKIISSKK